MAVLVMFAAPFQADKPRYTPATSDYGKVHAAWEYQGPWPEKVAPDFKLVAAEISLPAPPDGRFDLDDIDIFDADTGDCFGSDPSIHRLTPEGEFVDQDDPAVKERADYRGIFLWVVPRTVRRVNFGYWGGMLFMQPVPLGPTGRILPPQPSGEVAHIGPFGSSGKYDRHLALVHVHNWPRSMTPLGYSLVASGAAPDPDRCDGDRWLDVDAAGRAVSVPLVKRPYYEKERWFLVDFWCPKGSSPEGLNLFGEDNAPLPKPTAPITDPETLKRLAAAEQNLAARHRWLTRQ